MKNQPALAPLQRIHIDFAEKDGVNYLIIVDSHSNIDVVRGSFASHGLPEEVVSDNASQFTAHEFKTFMEVNGIKHT